MTIESSTNYSFGTKAIHAGAPLILPLVPLLNQSHFQQLLLNLSHPSHWVFTNTQIFFNPNRDNFEIAVAALESAKYAIALSSGSATTALVIQSLPINSHIVSSGDVYGGTHRYFTKVANTHGVEAQFVGNLVEDLQGALRENTRLVWLETPSNPTLQVTDIAKVKSILVDHEAKTGNKVLLAVDNTFLSPYLSNPLTHGADVVVHSVTKYINGHCLWESWQPTILNCTKDLDFCKMQLVQFLPHLTHGWHTEG